VLLLSFLSPPVPSPFFSSFFLFSVLPPAGPAGGFGAAADVEEAMLRGKNIKKLLRNLLTLGVDPVSGTGVHPDFTSGE
jgi:hypothetical protein